MENIHKCVYCKFWMAATVHQTGNKDLKRSCPVKGKKVSPDSYSCKYFSPHHSFYCDNNNCWLGFIVCLHRRRNPKEFKAHEICGRCRQFDPDIKEIIMDYYINRTPILPPPKKDRKLKRRKSRKIIIKRRPIKKKRKLKRRK